MLRLIFLSFSIEHNGEAMTSKGLRATCLSKYAKADASYNAGLTTKTFIGYRLCYAVFIFYQISYILFGYYIIII